MVTRQQVLHNKIPEHEKELTRNTNLRNDFLAVF